MSPPLADDPLTVDVRILVDSVKDALASVEKFTFMLSAGDRIKVAKVEKALDIVDRRIGRQ